MTKAICLISIFLILSQSGIRAADIESDYSISGTWKGKLEVLGEEFPLVFAFKEVGNGQARGFMLSPKHTSEKIPLSQVSLKDREVKLYCDLSNASFTGRLSPKSKKIKGDWSQDGNTLPLDLEFDGEKTIVDRPQNPKSTSAYTEREVTFLNKFSNYHLTGTLSVPKSSGRPVQAVILVSDSGPHDRDGSNFGHKPFWVIADFLARKGIAVLRYDDRGIGKSKGDFAEGSHLDFATDAWAAIEFLSQQKEIDRTKIGIIGHGEGGIIAPIVATKRDDIAFIVLLASPGVRGDETIMHQTSAIGEKAGLPKSFLNLTNQFSKALFEVLSQPIPNVAQVQELGLKFEAEAKKLTLADPTKFEGLKETMFRDLSRFEKPWLHNFLKHDPGPVLGKMTCPILALNGDLDLEVPAKIHLEAIETRLKAAGNRNSQTYELKGLNHLFQRAETGIPAQYSKIEETISPQVLKQISEWIEDVTGI